MKTFLKLLAAAVGAVACLASVAQAEITYKNEQTTSYNGGTNVLPVLSTNRFVNIDTPRTDTVLLWCNYKFHAAPTAGDATGITLRLFGGLESGKYESNSFLTVSFPGNSTTPVSILVPTNAPYGYMRAQFVNVSTNAIPTNVVLSYSFKQR